MTHHPLRDIPMDHLVALQAYLTEDQAVLDVPLRRTDRPRLDELEGYIQFATWGLFRMPRHTGPVFRAAPPLPAGADPYRAGEMLREHAFVRTTANPALRFATDDVYVIESVHGRDVGWLADDPHEQEVLFFTGTRFIVLAVDEAAGTRSVYLREVPDPRLHPSGPGDAAVESVHADADDQVLERLRAAARARDGLPLMLRTRDPHPERQATPLGLDDDGRRYPLA